MATGKGCAKIIQHCTSYNDDDTCNECDTDYVKTEGEWNCSEPIDNCITYFDDSICKTCSENYILTVGKRN